jgi:hypothetical protein
MRRRQLVGPLDPGDPTGPQGNVVVVCNPDNTATYEPGTVDQTWEEFTDKATGLDKLDLSWDNINSGASGETTETNPAGSNYDKGISLAVILNDEAYRFVDNWLLADPCGILNAVEVMLTDELCLKSFRTFEIKADNITYAPFAAPCEMEVKLREADPVWHCVHKTFIWDNWQNWFIDGGAKQHPCFLTAVEPRPRLLASARMGLSIFARTIPVISLIFNEDDDAFRRILNVDNFVDAPLIRDIITNVVDKCGLQVDTIFHDPASPYYNACLYFPQSGAMHVSDSSAVTSPGLSFHFENRWNITLAELLDKLKPLLKAEWYVTPGNTLVFLPKATFLNTTPILDLTAAGNELVWDRESLRYQFNGNKKPAYGRYEYQIDPSDLASQEIKPLYNDIVDYDGPTNNLMLEGSISKVFEFAPTGAVRDGRAREDYLPKTVTDGEQVAYALVIVLAVIIASLLAGVLSAGAAAALAAFLAIWAISIGIKAGNLRDLFEDAKYTGAVRVTAEQVATPRILIWDGVAMNRAKMVSVAPGSIAVNTFYNTDAEPYTTRNKFQYTPAAVFNFPMFFESYFLGNLYDTYHDDLDNPLKSLDSHQSFELDLYLCCPAMETLGVWSGGFSRIGYFIKIEERPGYDIMGRIEHFGLNYDDERISIRGQVFKIKT